MDSQQYLPERPRAYRINDFCRAFGISRSLVYVLIGNGKLRAVKIAGRTLIPADEAERLLRTETK
jgi:excisionase family DNA binding protein